MHRKKRWLVLIGSLWLGMLLAACQSRSTALPDPTPRPETPVATPSATAISSAATSEATQTSATTLPPPSATPSATNSPAPAPTARPTHPPTDMPRPTSVPAEIVSFRVTPDVAGPGGRVTLTWQATGERATLCPTARFVLFSEEDCREVALSGSTTFTVPLEAEGFQYIDLSLTVTSPASPQEATAQVRVAFPCERTWFFSGEPQAGICPRAPLRSTAAAQRFERGLMIWLANPGRYYIFHETPVLEGADRNRVDLINDPLQISGDTADGYDPPDGLYAPVSGFGLVWRGDVQQSAGYQQELGWALAPEFGYEAILQCDDALPSGGRSWQTCYLQGPEGEVIRLHPLGGWQRVDE